MFLSSIVELNLSRFFFYFKKSNCYDNILFNDSLVTGTWKNLEKKDKNPLNLNIKSISLAKF